MCSRHNDENKWTCMLLCTCCYEQNKFIAHQIGISVVPTHVKLRVSFISFVVGQGNPTRGPE